MRALPSSTCAGAARAPRHQHRSTHFAQGVEPQGLYGQFGLQKEGVEGDEQLLLGEQAALVDALDALRAAPAAPRRRGTVGHGGAPRSWRRAARLLVRALGGEEEALVVLQLAVAVADVASVTTTISAASAIDVVAAAAVSAALVVDFDAAVARARALRFVLRALRSRCMRRRDDCCCAAAAFSRRRTLSLSSRVARAARSTARARTRRLSLARACACVRVCV